MLLCLQRVKSVIRRVSDLLKEFSHEESSKLAQYKLDHAPTIGLMYEGLTTKILNRTLPPNLDLQVVSGFVTDDTGELGPQTDCMLVHGEGEQVPHTSAYKWHVKDVIATLEVKKTLYSAGIADAYVKLRAVVDSFGHHVEIPGNAFIDSERLMAMFARITDVQLLNTSEIDLLPYHLQLIFHTLALEWASPIRIVIGYDGFASQENLANAVVDLLAGKLGVHGFGVMGMPQLCVSGSYSVVKMNGEPYVAPLYREWWPILAASDANPLRLLIELLWTRLEYRFGINMPWGDDADDENLTAFLAVRGVQVCAREGWEMKQIAFNRPAE